MFGPVGPEKGNLNITLHTRYLISFYRVDGVPMQKTSSIKKWFFLFSMEEFE